MKRIIATDKSGYATERNISGLNFENYEVKRAPNLYRIPNYIYFRITGKAHPVWANLHCDLGQRGYDLLHFFNGVSISKRPWISTYETFLPRWGAYGKQRLKRGIKAMASPHCKQLIALSECAYRIQDDLLASYPAHRSEIMEKTIVLHPPQTPIISDYSEKPLSNDFIDIAFVGGLFFLKGGLEVLRVVDRLLKKGAPLRLHIVSSLITGDHATQAGSAELEAAQRLIEAHPSNITQVSSLTNNEVLNLFRRCHIGLLPSWADTYGYSVLEAQAAGCATLCSNVRALPEINPSEAGWTVEVPVNDLGYAIIGTEKEKKAFSESMEASLEENLIQIMNNPQLIQSKGRMGLKRIRESHHPEVQTKALETLYDKILGD